MKNGIALGVAAGLLVTVAFGCSSSGGSGGGGGTITTANNGGTLALITTTGFAVASAAFYKSSSPDTGVSLTYNDGHCVSAASTTPVTGAPADAGASITFSNGTRTVVAAKTGQTYQYFANTALGPSASWSITAAGGADISAGVIGSVRVPAVHTGLVLPSITAGSPATVTWTAGGADSVEITVSGGAGSGQICYAADNGSFTIPAIVTTSAGAGASVVVIGIDYGHFTFGSRDVLTTGVGSP